mgnify:CR=1 FL=1|tara:strand:+ start:581 stop:1243 length:663 start_codon:yes stop_codon:yes gene_type:complete
MKFIIFYIALININILYSETIAPGSFSITRIQYGGGGDWYADPSSLFNLLNYVKENTNIAVNQTEKRSKIGDDNFNKSSYFYLTGHGNIKLSTKEIVQLRDKLLEGAFLHVDDNYGLDKSFRREMKKVFPEKNWVELPPDHPIFNIYYTFPNGLPKVHEHDNNPPQALGLFNNSKLMVLYTYESDLGDGWEDIKVHNNPEKIRSQALQMGTNIIIYALSK